MKQRYIICRLLVLMLVLSLFPGTCFAAQDAAGQKAAGISGKHVIHIIWDGLSSSMYSNLKAAGLATPNIDELKARGTVINNVRTTIPSYGGAQAALVTGAYPGTNGFTYRYFDIATNAIISNTASTYKLNGQTIFEAINAARPEARTLVTGFSVATLSLEGRGVSASDEQHKLIEHVRGDSLVGFADTANDIINSIGSEAGLPDYTLAYSNDIKMLYWNTTTPDSATVAQKMAGSISAMDDKLGELINALKKKGIYEDTVIIINSLSSVYTTGAKINGSTMATDMTAVTGVPTAFGVVNSNTRAVIVKAYIMKYAQLSFTNLATQEDRNKILAYLSDPATNYGKYIKNVLNPADFKAPPVFADYLLNPLDEYTFCAAGSGLFRTDNIDEMDQFCIISGSGVLKDSNAEASGIVDLAPNVCRLLGVDPPANNEGTAWNIFDLEAPVIEVMADGPTDTSGVFTGKAAVTINSSDNIGIASLKYETGEGYKDYTGPFEIDRDCTLKVLATDAAGNVAEYERIFTFARLIGNVELSGDYELLGGCYYTDSAKLTIKGTVLVPDESLILKINGSQTPVVSQAFSKEVDLIDGLNTIEVQAYLNNIGNSVKVKVCRVFNPLITSFKDGDIVSNPQLDVLGKAAPGMAVTVNGIAASVDEGGIFKAQATLSEGLNEIKIMSTTGSFAKFTIASVGCYTPAVLKITNTVDKKVVRDTVFNLKGNVDKACKVTVNGVQTVLDDNLDFSADVALALGTNTISLVADYNGVLSEKTVKLIRINPDDIYTVYINWDGFAKYYYDMVNAGGLNSTPVLNSLISNGVFFTDARTGIPSITNPMQGSILSGAWSSITGNGYRYFDKNSNTVIQFARENKAETIAEAVLRQGLKTASVNQFMLLDRGTAAGDPNKPYIDAGGDYEARFDEAIKLINGEEAGEGAAKVQLDEVPRFIALYMDDLDGIGHNEADTYGVPVAADEAGRRASILERLKLMDAKLGEFIQACKDRGIYDNMAFVLTTDHGMAPFGQQGGTADEYTYSKLPDLISTLDGLGYKSELLFADQQPAADTDIVIVCVGLQAQLSFTESYTDIEIDTIINALKGKAYAGEIMKKQDMLEHGVMEGFADLLVSPAVPYSFKTITYDKAYIARGQHDSLEEEAQHIFALMWGKGVKKGVVYTENMHNIDFAQTLTALMGIEKPANAVGPVLKNALEDSTPPVITITGIKNNALLRSANIGISAGGGKIMESLLNGTVFNGGFVTTSGAYTLTVKASDLVGNISETTIKFIVDSTSPIITITGVKDGDKVREVRYIRVSTDEPACMTIRLNGLAYYGTKISKPGRYVLYIKAVDRLGNISEKTVNFIIDKKVKEPKKH